MCTLYLVKMLDLLLFLDLIRKKLKKNQGKIGLWNSVLLLWIPRFMLKLESWLERLNMPMCSIVSDSIFCKTSPTVCVCWHAPVRDEYVWHLVFFIIDAKGVSVGVYPDWLWCHANGQLVHWIFPEWNGGWRCGKRIAVSTIEMDTEYTNTCLVDTHLSADTQMVIFLDRSGQATKGHGSFAKSGCNFLIWCGVFWVLSLGMWTFLHHQVYVLTNKRAFLQISNHYYLPHSVQDLQVAIKTIFNGRSPEL